MHGKLATRAILSLSERTKMFLAMALPWTPLGELTTLPQTLYSDGKGDTSFPYLTPFGASILRPYRHFFSFHFEP